MENQQKRNIIYHILYHKEKCRCNLLIYNGILFNFVGVRRLELPTSTSRTWRASQLCYTPEYIKNNLLRLHVPNPASAGLANCATPRNFRTAKVMILISNQKDYFIILIIPVDHSEPLLFCTGSISESG